MVALHKGLADDAVRRGSEIPSRRDGEQEIVCRRRIRILTKVVHLQPHFHGRAGSGAVEIEANTSAANRSPNVAPFGVGLGQRGKRLDADLDA